MSEKKLIILDRDGIINADSDFFIKSPDEWNPLPGSLEAIGRLRACGYRVVVATNQSGITRGLFDMSTLNAINNKMHEAVYAVGGAIEAIFYCPHMPVDNCDCRKPKSGMFVEIAKRYRTPLKGVPMVGDSLRDLFAGFNAQCQTYLCLTGNGQTTLKKGGLPPGTQVFADLSAVVDHLLTFEEGENIGVVV